MEMIMIYIYYHLYLSLELTKYSYHGTENMLFLWYLKLLSTQWINRKIAIFYVYIDILSAIITGNTTQTSNPRTIKTLIGFIMYVSYTLFFTKYFNDIFALGVFVSAFSTWTDTLKIELKRWCGCSQNKENLNIK